MRRFCVLTVGRAGSTALMDHLATHPDIAVPGKNIDCVDQELVHPARLETHAAAYARLCAKPIATQDALVEAFFACNVDAAFAGFKTMPNRHKNLAAFVARPDVRFITLSRRDVASTVASFLMAMATDSWRRSGDAHATQLRFDAARDAGVVLGNLKYVLRSRQQLERVPNAIALVYEELCDPAFSNPRLDAFFGRHIRLDDPRPPTSGESYVANWPEFRAYIERQQRELTAGGQ
jgi:LPS sulfotransferase NodH